MWHSPKLFPSHEGDTTGHKSVLVACQQQCQQHEYDTRRRQSNMPYPVANLREKKKKKNRTRNAKQRSLPLLILRDRSTKHKASPSVREV